MTIPPPIKGSRLWLIVVGVLVIIGLIAASRFFHNLDSIFSPTVDTTPIRLSSNEKVESGTEIITDTSHPIQILSKPTKKARKTIERIVESDTPESKTEVTTEGPEEKIVLVETDKKTGIVTKRDLVKVLKIPPAPWGGDEAITVRQDTGEIEGYFKPNPRPLFALGGESAIGGEIDLGGKAIGYVRQDLIRVGKIYGYAKGSISYQVEQGLYTPTNRTPGFDYGVSIGAEIRFGQRR